MHGAIALCVRYVLVPPGGTCSTVHTHTHTHTHIRPASGMSCMLYATRTQRDVRILDYVQY